MASSHFASSGRWLEGEVACGSYLTASQPQLTAYGVIVEPLISNLRFPVRRTLFATLT
jgi:hypothetical protein